MTALGVKISSAQCPVCRQMVPVDIPGPWTGSLDDMASAAQEQVQATCPYAPGRHRIVRGARKRKYRHAPVRLAEPAS